MGRRDFLRGAVAGAAAFPLLGWPELAEGGDPKRSLLIGMFADAHNADKPPHGNRHYRDSIAKVTVALRDLTAARAALLVELGDFVDGDRVSDLQKIEALYKSTGRPCLHVLGNHDCDVSKEKFIAATGVKQLHYSLDAGSFHLVVLDANYRKNGKHYWSPGGGGAWTETYIPEPERAWLAADLARTRKPTLVFVHQRLDEDDNPHTVRNAPKVRRTLEGSRKVVAVFQGHDHRGDYGKIGRIHYYTLRALVEGPGVKNNSYALVRVGADGTVRLNGFCKQSSR